MSNITRQTLTLCLSIFVACFHFQRGSADWKLSQELPWKRWNIFISAHLKLKWIAFLRMIVIRITSIIIECASQAIRDALVSKVLPPFGCSFDSTKKFLSLNCKYNSDFAVDSENHNHLPIWKINNKKVIRMKINFSPFITEESSKFLCRLGYG